MNYKKAIKEVDKMKSICSEGRQEIKKVLAALCGEKIDNVFYKIGQKFEYNNGKYLLAQTGFSVCSLITIEGWDTGNRFSYGIRVGDTKHITQTEFDEICGTKKGQFTLV